MLTRWTRFGFCALASVAIFGSGACRKETIEPASAPPFRSSIQVGEILYLSGQVGLDPDTRELARGLRAETRQAMRNLERELEANGFGFSDVVATHVWMMDLSQIGEMSEVYRSFFPADRLPTRTTVGVSQLAVGARIEIAMVAARGEKLYVYPEGVEKGKAPFSPGVLVGDRLYLSGQAGVVPESGELIKGDIKAHVRQTLKNIERILKSAGMDFTHVVATEVFLTEVDDLGAVSDEYAARMKDPKPAYVPVVVSAIPLHSPLEITMVASRREKKAVQPEDMPARGAGSPGLLVDDTMYLAGVYSSRDTVEEEVSYGLGRLETILKKGGFGLGDVVEARVYLTDMGDYQAMNAAYRSYFPKKPPTRATIGVPVFPGSSRIGMAFVAARASP